jgi:hypothetical protein
MVIHHWALVAAAVSVANHADRCLHTQRLAMEDIQVEDIQLHTMWHKALAIALGKATAETVQQGTRGAALKIKQLRAAIIHSVSAGVAQPDKHVPCKPDLPFLVPLLMLLRTLASLSCISA